MCECMNRVNEHLKADNTRLSVSFCLSEDLSAMDMLPIVQTEKVKSQIRGKPMMAVASFCPFCGTKYPRKDDKSA